MDLTVALSAVGTTLGLAKGALEARDDARLRSAMVEMQQQLLEATQAALALSTQCFDLERARQSAEVRAQVAEAALRERSEHELFQLRPGAFVYRKKGDAGNQGRLGGPYWCQPCYDAGTRAALRHHEGASPGYSWWDCPIHAAHRIES